MAAFIFSLLTILAAKTVTADQGGYFYGGPSFTQNLSVNKTIQNPQTGSFVDNLGPQDVKFNPEQEVDFKISIKNPGNSDLSNVTIRDVFPSFVDFISGPDKVNWNKDTREVTSDFGGLKAGEVKEIDVKGKVVSKDNLPQDKSLICVSNFVEAKSDSNVDSDTTGLCIQNLAGLPGTGPDPWAVAAIFAIGATGIVLTKKADLKN